MALQGYKYLIKRAWIAFCGERSLLYLPNVDSSPVPQGCCALGDRLDLSTNGKECSLSSVMHRRMMEGFVEGGKSAITSSYCTRGGFPPCVACGRILAHF